MVEAKKPKKASDEKYGQVFLNKKRSPPPPIKLFSSLSKADTSTTLQQSVEGGMWVSPCAESWQFKLHTRSITDGEHEMTY